MNRWLLVTALVGCTYPEFGFTEPAVDSTVAVADTGVPAIDSTPMVEDTTVADTADTSPRTAETSDPNDTSVPPDTAVDTAVVDTMDTAVVDTAPVIVTILSRGSTWRYLDTGVAPPSTNWRGGGTFDDSTWKSGLAKLGFGDGDEKTLINRGLMDAGSDGDATFFTQYTSYYFRRSVTVVGAADFDQLTFRLRRDDGAIIYLNGTEVVRTNMPSGTISHTTYASTVVDGADEDTFYSFTVPAATLKEGANIIAAEVHQANPTSSDVCFDLELIGRKP
jgi:hypothetical protein